MIRKCLENDVRIRIISSLINYSFAVGFAVFLDYNIIVSIGFIIVCGVVTALMRRLYSTEDKDERDIELMGKAAEITVEKIGFPFAGMIFLNAVLAVLLMKFLQWISFVPNGMSFKDWTAKEILRVVLITSVEMSLYFPKIMRDLIYLRLEKKEAKLLDAE